ncbi:hypothetical protein [Psychrobacter sp. JB385]|uniref:hypothetical protein n=1 Tax=Psychrobacter sp. JB385 TaxID=1434841 RepID=UPI00097EF824|nr:hypothetical protein [Psychrobacter sp. JB385]SJN18257.1 hypothetical protein CZ794_01910 [Psychrobacter sp. JB385]
MSVALYLDLVSYEGKSVYQEVLVAHIEDIRRIIKDCESLKKYDASLTKLLSVDVEEPIKKIEGSLFKSVLTKLSIKNNNLNFALIKQYIDECNGFGAHEVLSPNRFEKLSFKLWDLFALSVCNDHLLWLLNQGKLTVAEYRSFFTDIGMQVSSIAQPYYHPFYHEIHYVDDVVRVGEHDQIIIKEQLYPTIMFGELQFSRGGVSVYNHPCVDKYLAEKSDMYFTNHRNNRLCHDLSHGWGHNSRWRTDFVRNYETEKEWKFNVDGEVDLSSAESYKQHYQQYNDEIPVSVPAAKELLVNRCFIHKNSIPQEIQSDLFPYDWHIDIAKDNFNYVQWKKKHLLDR